MANPSIVGGVKATSHYLQQPINWFTMIPTAGYLAGRILPLTGRTVPTWVSRASDAAVGSFMIYELGKVLSSPSSMAKDFHAGVSVIWGKKTHIDVRKNQKGDFPRVDNSYIGPKTWTAYRLAATTFKFVASGVAVYSWLKADAKVHPLIKFAAPVLAATAYLIDIGDRQLRINDHCEDVTGRHQPALALIKARIKKNSVDPEDEKELNDLLPTHWRGDQFISATFFFMKVVAATLALKELVKSDSLAGRVCQLVKTHEDNIWGALFVATVGATYIQHLFAGATLKELTTRTINKS